MLNDALAGSLLPLATMQCTGGTERCAAVGDLVLFMLLPTLGFAALGLACDAKIRSRWYRLGGLVLITLTWAFCLLFAFVHKVVLAGCSSACWY